MNSQLFRYTFFVPASVERVNRFHGDTDVLRKLTPPPLFVQIHRFGVMEEGMEAEFTLWFLFIPLRWLVRHVDVGRHGFTDVQLQGPLASWAHTHRFEAVGENKTQIREEIRYAYHRGWRGLLSRILFNALGLKLLFFYRQLVTTWGCRPIKSKGEQ